MRGLKLKSYIPSFHHRVASFTDAWIETLQPGQQKYPPSLSHLLQMRGLKLDLICIFLCFFQSHLLQMRGLKPIPIVPFISALMSHLLQMRGLKLTIYLEWKGFRWSHLLQMRGLKQRVKYMMKIGMSRIFYRCVD